ncbi:MAG: LysR family transcriptional regulator [Proteobacteria bacterium]|nr:LysR family transcriptional regulator [Pseudomonadota bacterium]
MPDVRGLDNLLVFAAVAETGGFTAAADRLGMTKAGVSLRIRRLEERLGAALFVRTTRQVRLTDAGQSLYDESTPALVALRDALARAGTARGALSGRLRLAAPVDHAAQVLAPAVAAFVAAHPEVAIELHTADRMIDLVAEGIDVAFRLGELRDSSLRATRLGSFEQAVVASPDYLARRGRPAQPDELAAHDWIAFALMRTPLTWTFTSADGRRTQRVRMRARLQVDSSSSLRALLEAGAGISVLDGRSVAAALAAGRLVRLLPRWTLPAGGIYAVYPPGRHVPALARAFVDAYRERLGP